MPSKNALRTTATTALSRISGFQKRFQVFRQAAEEIWRGERDQAEADRNHDHEQLEAIVFEVDGSESSRTVAAPMPNITTQRRRPTSG
jgi:hypothetical protein